MPGRRGLTWIKPARLQRVAARVSRSWARSPRSALRNRPPAECERPLELSAQRHFVLGERAGLVGADDGGRAQRLRCRERAREAGGGLGTGEAALGVGAETRQHLARSERVGFSTGWRGAIGPILSAGRRRALMCVNRPGATRFMPEAAPYRAQPVWRGASANSRAGKVPSATGGPRGGLYGMREPLGAALYSPEGRRHLGAMRSASGAVRRLARPLQGRAPRSARGAVHGLRPGNSRDACQR